MQIHIAPIPEDGLQFIIWKLYSIFKIQPKNTEEKPLNQNLQQIKWLAKKGLVSFADSKITSNLKVINKRLLSVEANFRNPPSKSI